MEILSPAGNLEAAKAAIAGGCDAIYLGAKAFSARAGAQNFDDSELIQVIDLAHAYGVRIHMAINTIIADKEMQDALDLACKAYSLGVDALIVQDVGFAGLVHQNLPDMPLHASTQMTVHTLEGVKKVAEMGFSRAILARELSIKEIAHIVKHAPIEVECFIHGALCMSVSGQCYLSAAIGGRSGNRGRCAGTCRLPFSKTGQKGRYDLSLKDLCAIEQIRLLDQMGVASVKIEGRLKRADYVYQVTKSCREALDSSTPPDKKLLADLFSRSGFTDGYFTGKIDDSMFGVRSEQDVKNTRATTLQMKDVKKVPVEMHFSLDETAVLRVTDYTHEVEVTAPAAKAEGMPISHLKIMASLEKLGGTPYISESACAVSTGVHTMSVSQINAMRREAIQKLTALRQQNNRKQVAPTQVTLQKHDHTPKTLRARFETVAQMGDLAMEFDFISLPIGEVMRHRDALSGLKDKLIIELPRMCFDCEDSVRAQVDALKDHGFAMFEAQNIAQVNMCTHTGMSLNVYNGFAAQNLAAMGIDTVTLSQEMHHRQIKDISYGGKTAMIAYGYMPLMVMRACPNKGKGGCQSCKGHRTLTDRYGKQFKIFCQKSWAFLLNNTPVYMGDKREWCSADELVLYFTDESAARAKQVTELFKSQAAFDTEFTRGLYGRGVQNE